MVNHIRAALSAVLFSAVLTVSATAQTAPPSESEATRLIWSTLLAIDHANRTGNYTVLRDLGATEFRDANDAARLADVFMGTRDLPLGQAILYRPQLSAAPIIEEDGLLRLSGRIPMRPDAVLFDILFAQAGTDWLLFGLSVGLEQPALEENEEVPE